MEVTKLCLIVLLLVTLNYVSNSYCYEQDKLYHYRFAGSFSSKLASDPKTQSAGVSIESPLSLKRTANDELTVRLDDPKWSVFNGVPSASAEFKEMDPSLAKAFKIYLDSSDGSFKAFNTIKDEPTWARNFKRGLLSLLQLKIKGDHQSESFVTSEKSVFGECETEYVIVANQGEQNTLNVTKSRNMAKCKSRWTHRYSPIDSIECYDSDKDSQLYRHSNAIFSYNLIGTRSEYVIDEAKLDESYVSSPFGQKSYTSQVDSRFTLTLINVEPSGNLVADSSAEQIDSLAYEPPEVINFYANINLETEHHTANLFQVTASVDQVLSAIDEFVKEHRNYTGATDGSLAELLPNYQENSPVGYYFMRIVELAGTLNLQKLDKLYSAIDERGEVHKRVFWDVMSSTGTNPSFMFMKKLITEGEAPSTKVKAYLSQLSFHIKLPSKSLFDEYVNLCKSDKIQTNREYKKLCVLPLTSLINQHCVKPHSRFMRIQSEGGNGTSYKRGQNTCQIATADEYFSRIVQTFTPSSSEPNSESELAIGDKLLNIKLAGELGVRPTVDFLKEILKAKNEHPIVRSAAMWNLMKAASIYPNIVKRLVLPYYYDTNENLEVRIGAYLNLMKSAPTLNEIESLAKRLESEPNRQLVLYVHSLLNSMGSIDWLPCGNSAEKTARLILPTIKRALSRHPPGSLGDSHAFISANWLPEFGFGSIKAYSAIYGDEGFAPSNIFFLSNEIMAGGIKTTPLMVSIQAHGLDKLIKRVIGINGLLSDKESFMDVFSKRRAKRQANIIKQEVAEIDKELKLATREFSDVYLAITVSYYGRPIVFIERDSRELKKMLSDDGTIKIPHIKKLIHSFNNHTSLNMKIGAERLEMFNNELGFPIVQSMSDFEHDYFKLNSIKFDVEPGFFKDERQGKPPTKIVVSIDAKSSKHREFVGATGLLIGPLKQQVSVGFMKKRITNLPMKQSLEINLLEQKVTVKRQPIHDNIMYVRHTPVTFVRNYDPSKLADINIKPLYPLNESASMKDFKIDYMTPLAIGLKAEGKHKHSFELGSSSIIRHLKQVGLGAAQFLLNYAPSGSPLELRLSTITTDTNPTKEMSTVISWHHYHDTEPVQGDDKELEQLVASKSSSAADKKPVTVHYELALLGGSNKERRVALGLSYSRSFDRSFHKWKLSYQRTPLDQAGDASSPYSEATNLCWLGQLQFPKYDIKRWLKFDLLSLDHVANVSSEVTFSDTCNLDSANKAEGSNAPRLSIQAKFDWSYEQRNTFEKILSNQGRESLQSGAIQNGELLNLYERCQDQRSKNKVLIDPSCLQFLLKASELTNIKSSIDYHQVPARWIKILSKLGSLYTSARSGYMEEMDESGSQAYKSGDTNKLERALIEANMTSNSFDKKINYEINAPHYHVLYKSIPFNLPPLNNFPLAGGSYYQMVRRQAGHRFCTVGSQSVTTFDNLTYTMPQINDGCFKLIAKDCSPENNYVVLGAAASTGKVVKVYIAGKYKVEFIPDKEGKSVSEVKLDGEAIQVASQATPMKQMTKMGANSHEAFSIENNGAYYTLNSKLYRFSVSTDGTWILVQQSKYYAGKSCGICGDANGVQIQEFRSPSSTEKVCKNANSFVWAHVLPSTCESRPTNIDC